MRKEQIEIYSVVDGEKKLIGKMIRPIRANESYWLEMTKGQKKACLIKALVELMLPTGDYCGIAFYKHDFDGEVTGVESEIIHFIRRGE